MKQRQTRKPFGLFLASVILMALVMLVTLSAPAFAAGAPAKELRMAWLDWTEDGRCYANDGVLDMKNSDGADGMGYAPGRGDHVIFFIWNNSTQRKEKFVVPQASGGLKVIPVDADSIAKNAKQSQYYVRLEMDGWDDAELTADGLTFHVTAAMDDFAFFSSQNFSQETYLSNEVNEEALADCTVYFGNSYAGTDGAGEHDKIVSVEKAQNGDENLYTVEKVSDDCWKIVYKDVFAVWGNIGVDLKLEVRQPDGGTREDGRGLWIVHETAPQLWFVPIDGEWSDEEGHDVFWYNPDRDDLRGNGFRVYGAGYAETGLFAYGGEWTENGFNRDGLTPVSVKDLKLPEGIAATAVPAREGAQWGEYYVDLSLDELDKEYTISYNGYELTMNSHLPEIGVYTDPEAAWDNWAGPWGFPYNAIWDNNEYYFISTAADQRDGRHLTAMALSADWNKEDEEVANGDVELARVGDGVYKLTLKDGALKRGVFHVDLDLTWTDVAGNSWTDTNCYFGNFDYMGAVMAADAPLYDGTSKKVDPFPAADAKDKVADSVTMKAGEDKVVYLYRSAFSWSLGPLVVSPAIRGYYHSANEELTLTQDEADITKFTLSCAKPGVYEIYTGSQEYDWDSLKVYHADGTQYTQEEFDEFMELPFNVEDGVFVIYDEEYNPTPFTEMFPGDTYELEALDGIYDWEEARLTVIVEPSYTDVAAGDWFCSDVAYVSVNGLMNGTGETTFNPYGYVSRAMVPTVLYRLAGQPAAPAGSFTDVAAGMWYTDAISWAAENGIVNGVGSGAFGVDSDITREQLVTMLYRYAKYAGCDMTASNDLSSFNDAGSVHDWALKEMQWAVGAGLINGKGAGLDPQGAATRAELAAILARFCRDVL